MLQVMIPPMFFFFLGLICFYEEMDCTKDVCLIVLLSLLLYELFFCLVFFGYCNDLIASLLVVHICLSLSFLLLPFIDS